MRCRSSTSRRSSTGPGTGPRVAAAIDSACREHGFFTITGHGVDRALLDRLDEQARAFFALDEDEKAEIAMPRAGPRLAGLVPGRRRAHERHPGPQGRHLLRRRARP